MKFVAIFLLGASSLAFAQPPKPEPNPTISNELKIELFKAEAQFNQAQLALKNAQEDLPVKQQVFQSVVQKLATACGKFALQLDGTGDPICIVPPEPPKPATTEVKPALKK